MDYKSISIKANPDEQEMLIAELSEFGASGFEQQKELLIAWFPQQDFDMTSIKEVLNAFPFMVEDIAGRNWNELWESNFEPVTIGNFCSVRASFHKPQANVLHEIIITPKMSFGTGHHATTWLMIDKMSNMEWQGKTVFDFGTGTGILAILAAKLGASSIDAIDCDEWSINNASENIAINEANNIHLYQEEKPSSGPFDIILANINKNVILQYLANLVLSMKPGAKLLLSGLLVSDETEIVKSANIHKLRLLDKGMKDGWVSLLFMN